MNNIPIPDVSGQIDAHNTATDSHADIRSNLSDFNTRLSTLEASVVTIHSGAETAMTSDVGEDGDIYLITE